MVYWHHVNTDKHNEKIVVGPIKPGRQRYPHQKLYIGIDSCGTERQYQGNNPLSITSCL